MDLDDFDDLSQGMNSFRPGTSNMQNFPSNMDMFSDFGDSTMGAGNYGTLPPLSSVMGSNGEYMQPDGDAPPVFFNENTRFVNVASSPLGRACACCALILFILLLLAGLGVLGLSILAIIFSVQIRNDVNHLRLNIVYPVQPVAPPILY